MIRLRLAATLIVSTGLLVGCGGSDSDSTPSTDSTSSPVPDADPATGDTLTADDFSLKAPDGWKENDGASMPSINFLALAVDPDDHDGFSDNVNVISDPTLTPVKGVDQIGEAVEKVLKGMAEDVELRDPASVDGSDAAVVAATLTQGSIKYKTVQYAIVHDGNGYVVTFSFSNDRPETEQREIARSVMASWTWSP